MYLMLSKKYSFYPDYTCGSFGENGEGVMLDNLFEAMDKICSIWKHFEGRFFDHIEGQI